MDEATKYLLGQGVLGIACIIEAWMIRRLWMENKNLTDRLEAKADKHAEKNQEIARQVTEAFEAAVRNSERPRRRATAAKLPAAGGDE
jgi:predicted secreted Zn-dependent protease